MKQSGSDSVKQNRQTRLERSGAGLFSIPACFLDYQTPTKYTLTRPQRRSSLRLFLNVVYLNTNPPQGIIATRTLNLIGIFNSLIKTPKNDAERR